MKKVVVTALICFVANFISAQTDYTKSLKGIDWVKITSSANVKIVAHDKDEILIKSKEAYYAPERSKGLRLVGTEGTDNTNLGFSVLEEGNDLIVRNLKKNQNATIYLPKDQKIAITSNWNGYININGFRGEIEANCKLNGGIKIENITGPLTANSLNGGIDVVFNDIDQNSPTSIYTTNGAVDVTLPANTKANLSLSSWNGDVYSNFDIEKASKDGMKKVSGKKAAGTINGGGVSITLKSTNGNIYLRKK